MPRPRPPLLPAPPDTTRCIGCKRPADALATLQWGYRVCSYECYVGELDAGVLADRPPALPRMKRPYAQSTRLVHR